MKSTNAAIGRHAGGEDTAGEAATAGGARPSQPPGRFPVRGLVLGLVLCPLLIFWGEYTELVARGPDLIALSLPTVLLFPLLVLLAGNALLARLLPRAALGPRDLLYAYAINLATITVCGFGMMQYLVSFLAAARHFATPENGWADSWLPRVPAWALPDPSVVPAFYEGRASFFAPGVARGWAAPILAWSAFLFAMLGFSYCLGTLLRRQWTERERLLFPMAVLPLEVVQGDGTPAAAGSRPLWRSGPLWCAALLAFGLESLASIHYSIDSRVPYLPIKFNEGAFDIGSGLTAAPWNGVGGLSISLYPFVIGLAYLLPLDISFSCWFFFLLTKAEGVLAVALGAGGGAASGSAAARAPFANEQATGGFLALALLSAAGALPHLRGAFRRAFPEPGRGAAVAGGGDDDSDEPLSYRAAFLGLFGSSVVLFGFGIALGIAPTACVLFFGAFFLLALACARIRAQAGFPWSQGPSATSLLINLGGTANYGAASLVGISCLRWFDWSFRSTALPFQMEAMRIAEGAGIRGRHLTLGVVLTGVLAVAASWVCLLGLFYHHGAGSARVNQWIPAVGRYNFDHLQDWLRNPRAADVPGLAWAGGGAAATLGLSALYSRLPGWPLHPVGYVAGTGDFLMPVFWFPVLLGWLCKSMALRYGGMRLYRRLLPAALGLILGDYAASGLWSLLYLWLGIPGYKTFPN